MALTPTYKVKCPLDGEDVEFSLTIDDVRAIVESPSGVYDKRIKHGNHYIIVTIGQDFTIRDVKVDTRLPIIERRKEVEELDLTEYELDPKAEKLLPPQDLEKIRAALRQGSVTPDIVDLVYTLIESGLLRKRVKS